MNALVVVSNRVPAPAAPSSAGGLTVGIVEALENHGGLWFGWSGCVSPERSRSPHIENLGAIQYLTADLTQDDVDQYYLGYANSVLWPLLHTRLPAISYCERDWHSYIDVNRYFASLLTQQLHGGEIIWIHDYHLLPLAKMLRQLGVREKIGLFIHTPFPPADVFRTLPYHGELLDALSYFDLVGVQTSMDLRNLCDCFEYIAQAEVMHESIVSLGVRRFRVGSFPIGINPEQIAKTAHSAYMSEETLRLKDSLQGRKLMIGVDRLDYTKGLMDRFLAYEHFLEKYRSEMEAQVVFLQVTPPTRATIPEYIQITQELERQAGHINGHYNQYDKLPLRYLNQQFDRDALMGFFALADVGLVTPLRDGMNLVAKEFIAAQPERDPGVLVLSSLAGAAEEMDAAVIVNPYNKEEVADAIYAAMTMTIRERRERWEHLMETLQQNTAAHWRERFLNVLKQEQPRLHTHCTRPSEVLN